MTLSATVAVDVGGTKIRAGSVIDGELAHVRSVPTPATAGARAVLDTIAEVAAAVIAETSGARGADTGGHGSAATAGRGSAGSGGLVGGGGGSGSDFVWRIGIGAAGVIDQSSGLVVSATESLPGWAGTDLVAELTARTGLPVRVVNDVHAHALGEAAAGASRGARSCLLVAAGTGIGGGFIADGHLLTGRNSAAGHIGHVPVAAATGLGCPCGGTGHVEAIASGPAVLETYRRLAYGSAEPAPRPAEPAAHEHSHNQESANPSSSSSGPNLGSDRDAAAASVNSACVPANTRELAAAASAGDVLALRAFETGARALGSALGGIVNVLSPELVVIGGGLAEMDSTWWSPLRAAFAAELIPAASGTPLVKAELGQDAALIGAAGLWNDEPDETH